MDDEKIIELYWQRDEGAVAAVSAKYGAYCTKIAVSILTSPEDAQECVNDTWLRAWAAIPPHRPERLSVFLGKITRELSLNRYKARLAQKRGGGELALALDELDELVADRQDSAEQLLEYELLSAAISLFLKSQPEKMSSLFIRRYYHLLSIRQLSAEFGMGESRVKSALFRLGKKLKSYLEGEGIIL